MSILGRLFRRLLPRRAPGADGSRYVAPVSFRRARRP
jgi:hypothetical protein